MSLTIPLLFLISGLPRTGKNRAGVFLATHFNGDHFALSDILKTETHKHYGLAEDLSIFHFESTKDVPNDVFEGLTPREAYINFSEKIIKPKLGKSYLGERVLPRVIRNKRNKTPSIISGVGFIAEVRPLIESVGPAQTIHITIIRKDAPFAILQDSRQKLQLNDIGVAEVAIETSVEDAFIAQVERYIAQEF